MQGLAEPRSSLGAVFPHSHSPCHDLCCSQARCDNRGPMDASFLLEMPFKTPHPKTMPAQVPAV